jgi:protein tyrosine/serine phosphatase
MIPAQIYGLSIDEVSRIMRTVVFSGIGLALLVALLAPQPVAFAERALSLPTGVSRDDLPRFLQVADDLYRGGQPRDAGFRALQKMGIKTIINFREVNQEKELAESLGMKSIHIPLSAARGVPGAAIRQFFEILRDRNNYPIFFHCRRGADRTGAMAGFYRMGFQGWNGKKASREAREIGMRWWYRNLKGQIERFDSSLY